MPYLQAKKVSGRLYYYLRHNHRVDGKPRRAWEIYLGTLSDLSKLLPTNGPASAATTPRVTVREFGAVAALWDVAERLQVRELIDVQVPAVAPGLSVGRYMVLAAINRCVNPCSKNRMADWYSQTALCRWLPARRSQLSSQRFWDAMGQLQKEHLVTIEREVDRRLIERFGVSTECLAYDATNFFSFIDTDTTSDLAQRGHSKERRIDLRQISLALVVSREFHIPLFHEPYPGNRPDAPEFSRVVEELVQRQQVLGRSAEEITLVFDKGNNSKDNVKNLNFHFVGSLVPTQHKDLLTVPLAQFSPLQGSGLQGFTAYRAEKEVFGRSVAIVMTYNPRLFEKQMRGLLWQMGKCEKGLRELEEKLARWRRGGGRRPHPDKHVPRLLKARHMKQLYDVRTEESADGPRFVWTRNEAELAHLREHLLGRTLIFTDQKGWSSEQIVRAYRGQYQIEQAFHWMKSPQIVRWWPMHHWTDQKIRVHAFYCVLALLLLSLLRRELVRAGHDWSIEKILRVLGGIREVEMVGGTTARTILLTSMKGEAQTVYDQLNLAKYRAV